jgi:magnesium transporter
VALLREVDPGEVGRAERVKPTERRPPRGFLFRPDGSREDIPIRGCVARLASSSGFLYADFHAPNEEELEGLQREFHFHPLAIEDVRTRHQRPKIDIYGDQYFLVFYRIGSSAAHDGDWVLQEIDFFIGPNFLITTHDSEVPFLDRVVDRFSRSEGKKDVSGLLYDMLDTIVDEYFDFLDDIGERSGKLEEEIFERYESTHLERLLDLKQDLVRLRQVVAPGRDAVNVLLRRDPPVLDAARIPYFQDIYDHLIRVSDSIDTYRELATGLLDALLSIQNNRLSEQNNRLSEVVKKLTIISIIFLPLNFVTGFWGMNFEATSGRSYAWFFAALAMMALIPSLVVFFLRRRGIE